MTVAVDFNQPKSKGRRSIPRAVQRQKQLCVSMDRDTLGEIDAAAKAENLTRSEWVRLRLEWALMDRA